MNERKVTIACIDESCSGVIFHESQLTDLSPRVEGECSVCKSFSSIKLKNIEEGRILKTEVAGK